MDHFEQALSTLLVGNNLVTIAAATLSSQLAIQLFGPKWGVVISTVVVTFLVLVFGELLPKLFAKEFAETYALRISAIIFWMMRLFTPLNWFFFPAEKYRLASDPPEGIQSFGD